MPYEIIEETAKVYRVRFRREGEESPRYEYCEATVRPFPGGGSLSIQSSYGTYAYTWCAIGPGPFTAFLLDLDFDYFMGKARPGYREFDAEATIESMRRTVISARREGWGGVTKEAARQAWEALDHADPCCRSAEYFLSELLRCEAISEMLGGDYCDLCRERPNPNARGFWEELWPVLCAHWREEIAPAASVAAA